MQSLLFACEYKTLESWRILKVRLENCFSWKSDSFNIGRIRKFAFKGRGEGGGGEISVLRSSGYVGKFHRKWSKFGTIVYSKTKTKRKKFKLISIFSNQEKLYKICSTFHAVLGRLCDFSKQIPADAVRCLRHRRGRLQASHPLNVILSALQQVLEDSRRGRLYLQEPVVLLHPIRCVSIMYTVGILTGR